MEDDIKRWIFDPTIAKLTSALIGIIVVVVVGRLLRKSVERYVTDNATRYQVRKVISLLVYVAAAVVLATVYSSKLAGLTMAFGVAGAGIAFALQEVIASIAGQTYRAGEPKAIAHGERFEAHLGQLAVRNRNQGAV